MSNFDSIDDALDIECTREPNVHVVVNGCDETSLEVTTERAPMAEREKVFWYANDQLYALLEKG